MSSFGDVASWVVWAGAGGGRAWRLGVGGGGADECVGLRGRSGQVGGRAAGHQPLDGADGVRAVGVAVLVPAVAGDRMVGVHVVVMTSVHYGGDGQPPGNCLHVAVYAEAPANTQHI